MIGNDEHTGDRRTDRESMASFEEGRYLYCVVDASRSFDAEEFTADGLDEGAYVITDEASDVGVVAHACDSMYDTEDPTQIRKWLLAHQRVVDEAGDVFGTPIPFRFHTILPGDDETVRSWLAQADDLREHLERLAGHWEYRITLRLDEDQLEPRLVAEDDELRSLQARKEAAESGTSFLLDKQFEQQLRKRKRAHVEELIEQLRELIAPHVERAERLGRRRATLDGMESADASEQRIATLTHESDVDALGAALDEIAARPGVQIEFTGPWPPYTFAPSVGPSEGDEAGTR